MSVEICRKRMLEEIVEVSSKRLKTELKWITPSSTRNYALKNALVDWFNCHGESNGFVKDASKFTPTIMDNGHVFEEKINNLLKLKFGNLYIHLGGCHANSDSTEIYCKTLKALRDGIPIISSGILRDEDERIFGCPDLMIRSDYISQILRFSPFESKEYKEYKVETPAPLIEGTNYHYFIVDVKNTALKLLSNGLYLSNTGSIPAYKTQLYLYHRILSKIQGYDSGLAFILGKSVAFGKDYKGDYFDRFGLIDYKENDDEIVKTAKGAVEWLREVESKGGEWDVYNPTRPEMFPNMTCDSDYPWSSAKKQVAKRTEEITLLWNCGIRERRLAHLNGIYKLSDPRLTTEIMDIKGERKRIIDNLLKVNKSDNNKIIETNNLHIPVYDHEFYVDFETMNNDVDNDLRVDSNFIYMIGVYYKNNIHPEASSFCYFMADDFTRNEEESVCKGFVEFLNEIKIKSKKLLHWGKHEQTTWEKVLKRHPSVEKEWKKYSVEWVDLYSLVTKTPVVVKGAYKFSVKEMANSLCKQGLIKSCYKDSLIGDGLEATIAVIDAWKESKEKNIKLTQTDIIKDIIDYNELDCILLEEIVDCIRKQYISTV